MACIITTLLMLAPIGPGRHHRRPANVGAIATRGVETATFAACVGVTTVLVVACLYTFDLIQAPSLEVCAKF